MQTLRLHDSWAVMLEVALLETEISTKTGMNSIWCQVVAHCKPMSSHAWSLSFCEAHMHEGLHVFWELGVFVFFFVSVWNFFSLFWWVLQVLWEQTSVQCSCQIPATRKSFLETRWPHQNQNLIPYCKTLWTTIKKRRKPNKAPL